MTLMTAGFIDGSEVHGETLRRAFWIAMRGSYGVANQDSLKVKPTPTPSAGVLIGPGGGAVQQSYADAPAIQTYTVANDADIFLPIPANNSGSTVVWQVIARVKDPQYAGESTPANPRTDPYTVVEAVSSLPTGKPYLHLATINLTPNTAVVNGGAIVDRRVLFAPRQQAEPVRIQRPTVGNEFLNNNYAGWPSETAIGGSKQTYTAPKWATSATVRVTVAGLYTTGPTPIYGGLRLMFNGSATEHVIVYSEGSPNRVTAIGTWNLDIPAAIRGGSAVFELQANNSSGGTGKTIKGDNQTQVTWDVTWLEVV